MKSNFKRVVILLILLVLTFQTQAQNDFRGYYTKINKGEAWEKYSRTTEHADIIVELNEGKLVFWRGTSYLPCWETENGSWSFEEVIERNGDGTDKRPDKHNTFSHVKLVESSDDRIIVMWRYLPTFGAGNPKKNVNHLEFVEEYFTIFPDGIVERTIRQGKPKFNAWQAEENAIYEKIKLSAEGIDVEETVNSNSSSTYTKIQGNPVMENRRIKPVLGFNFDRGIGDHATEFVSSNEYSIDGHKSYWKQGISGTALAFDGYESQVRIPSSDIPKIDNFTIEAWVSLAAYPYNWAPIIHQSEWRKKGFYLGVDAMGRIGFKLKSGNWRELTTLYELPINQWVHVAATYDGKSMKIFINGKERGVLHTSDKPAFSNKDLIIGRNSHKMIPFNPVRIYCHECHTPDLYSLDALIDEVSIYGKAFTKDEIKTSFQDAFPGFAIINNPDLDDRKLPKGPSTGNFEAHYTHLDYCDTWDNLARFGKYCDLVVEFDELPTKFIFWRGMSYVPQIVNDKNQWYNNQFNESWDPGGSWGEPMSDKKSNFSHVRLIENTPARKVIHWRYAQVQINGTQQNFDEKTEWSDWSDWYYYIYPDGVACKRMVHWSSDNPEDHEWQESIGVMEQGQTPESISHVYENTVTLADFEISKSYDWSEENPEILEKHWEEKPLQIQQINYKSDYKPFTIADFSSGELYGDADGRRAAYSKMVVYTHWPLGQLPTDGVRAIKPDRASSNGYTHLMFEGSDKKGKNWAQRHMLEGMNTMSIPELRVLAKSWLKPAEINSIKGGQSYGYDQAQRAYIFNMEHEDLSFNILGSEDTPIQNLCFVIKNWNTNKKASLNINGKEIPAGKIFRQGIVIDTDGNEMLIMFTEFSAEEETKIKIN